MAVLRCSRAGNLSALGVLGFLQISDDAWRSAIIVQEGSPELFVLGFCFCTIELGPFGHKGIACVALLRKISVRRVERCLSLFEELLQMILHVFIDMPEAKQLRYVRPDLAAR